MNSNIKQLEKIINNCPKRYLPNNKLKMLGIPKKPKILRKIREQEIKRYWAINKPIIFNLMCDILDNEIQSKFYQVIGNFEDIKNIEYGDKV